MSRWLGVDFGTRRIGLAVGDSDGRVVSPLEQLDARGTGVQQVFDRIKILAENYGAVGVVVGWPINADGSRGRQAEIALEFAAELARRTGLDVRLWNERLTSFEADFRLRGLLTRGKKRRRKDSLAAASILDDFFSNHGPTSARRPGELS